MVGCVESVYLFIFLPKMKNLQNIHTENSREP
jgi:hypothetical protein